MSREDDILVDVRDFDDDVLKRIRHYNKLSSGIGEWLANMYYKNGKYYMGKVVTGNYDGVRVDREQLFADDTPFIMKKICDDVGLTPQQGMQMMQSNETLNLTKEDIVAPIHYHPMKDPDTYWKRGRFSGVDIASEFAKAIHNDTNRKLFLTHPVFGKWGTTTNVVKGINFPGRKSIDTMKASNPHLTDDEIMSITEKGEGRELVDWAAYQKEAEKRGQMQTINIEERTGQRSQMVQANTFLGISIGAMALLLGIVVYKNIKNNKKDKNVK